MTWSRRPCSRERCNPVGLLANRLSSASRSAPPGGAGAKGGEGGATQEEAAEGGAAVETAWAPQDTEELLDAIATQDYGVSDDRSSKLTAPALRAYNKALKSEYGHYELRRGRTLPEGFTVVKVSAHVWPMRCECE